MVGFRSSGEKPGEILRNQRKPHVKTWRNSGYVWRGTRKWNRRNIQKPIESRGHQVKPGDELEKKSEKGLRTGTFYVLPCTCAFRAVHGLCSVVSVKAAGVHRCRTLMWAKGVGLGKCVFDWEHGGQSYTTELQRGAKMDLCCWTFKESTQIKLFQWFYQLYGNLCIWQLAKCLKSQQLTMKWGMPVVFVFEMRRMCTGPYETEHLKVWHGRAIISLKCPAGSSRQALCNTGTSTIYGLQLFRGSRGKRCAA